MVWLGAQGTWLPAVIALVWMWSWGVKPKSVHSECLLDKEAACQQEGSPSEAKADVEGALSGDMALPTAEHLCTHQPFISPPQPVSVV